jgi:hypothetical protein
LRLPDRPRDRLEQGVGAVLRRLEMGSDKVSIRFAPDLNFEVEAEGQRLRAAYNIQTERVTLRPFDEEENRLSNRRFITGLHLASGYPSRLGVRWFWALAVDVMAAAMVVWGCSGLLMWWQMKSLRRWGVVALVISVVAAAALATTMHPVLPR